MGILTILIILTESRVNTSFLNTEKQYSGSYQGVKPLHGQNETYIPLVEQPRWIEKSKMFLGSVILKRPLNTEFKYTNKVTFGNKIYL